MTSCSPPTTWSKAMVKLVRSLARKKGRRQTGLFLAEGPKVVGELAEHFGCRLVAATEEAASSLPLAAQRAHLVVVSPEQLRQASLMDAPQGVLALMELPAAKVPPLPQPGELVLALDGVQDPGNLGTIVRTADWFGIGHIVCSHATADAFAPKVVQATMGSLARVSVHYADLPTYLQAAAQAAPVWATTLDGAPLYHAQLGGGGVLLMGSEGHGVSPEALRWASRRVRIPAFPQGAPTAESLNVAVATAICCAEMRRQARCE